MARQPKGPRVPETYRCANPECGHLMLVSGYSVDSPGDTPPERVHHVTETGVLPFTLLCACGHYTVVSPWREGA